ncbi:4-coumarate--CoA ligase 1-like [Nylanderia fulva]|uniref:4-coumarate--CoA ligase 1-like n=1 Tax=Nylanderia fulva TaxID=613905 RepID=UPI0010FB1C77|nr:4-coumarate--CoA ligase 1-like [Nylanderia fulva]
MATHAFRGIQKLNRVLDASIKVLNSSLRCASTSLQTRLVTGSNGEKTFIASNDLSYPETIIHEFIWNNIENYPDHIALECGISGKKYTYAQAKDATYYIGRSLRHIGLKEGDVIALVAPNLPDAILAFLGSSSSGLIITTMNPFCTANEMSNQLTKANAKAVITSASIASTVLAATRASLPPGTPFIVIDDKAGSIPDGSIPFDDLITRGKSLPPVSTKATCDDVAILPFSSGTTGLPKGVMLTHRNLVSNIEMTQASFGDSYRPTTSTYQESYPLILPFFHIYGLNGVALSRLAYGAKIVCVPKFIPETFLDVMHKSKATGLFCVPPIILFLSASPLVKMHHLEHLHSIISGAAPLAKTDVDKLFNKFNIDSTNIRFRQGYGLTETSSVAFVENGEKFSSIGKTVDGTQARLVNIETQQDIATPGETGELWIKGPHVMKGYLNNEAATKATLTEDKWLKTGDIAYYDEDYDFFITDRLKELIKVKGFQVPPAELEALLRSHPDVDEAAVIGIPHPRCGEVPKAFIVASKGKTPTEDDIKNFVKGKVSDYKELEGGVTFINEIPKNPSGKILRSKLKSTYHS